MPRKATAWSTTSFRDSSSGGYVPGTNDGFVDYSNNTAFINRPNPGGFVEYSNDTGLAPGATIGMPSDNGQNFGSYVPAPPSHYNGPFTHTDVAFAGTSTRSSFSPPHHSGHSTISNIGRNVYDTINSTFGPKHTDVAFAGTSTRSSDNNGDFNSSFGGTSFR